MPKTKIVSTGMIGSFKYLGLDPSICLAKNFRISMKIYMKLHSEWHTLRHVACGQATGDRRGQDAPVLPRRGRWSRLRHVWASGSKRFSSTKNPQRTGEGHGFFWRQRAKAIILGILSFNLKKWHRYRIFCQFLSLRSICFCCPA